MFYRIFYEQIKWMKTGQQERISHRQLNTYCTMRTQLSL